MTHSMIHRGEIVEKTLRKSGYSLTKLAAKLGISRNTLYNRFKNADLSYHFIMEVGKVIYYDFTLDFPEMKENVDRSSAAYDLLEKDQTTELWRIEKKYAELLEKHAKLLAILARTANENELPTLHQEIAQMLASDTKSHIKRVRKN
jgi:DNA-binding XRE family transcriptional regulator